MVDTPDGCAVIQRDLDRMERWAYRGLMKFNKGQSNVLHLGEITPCSCAGWGLKSSFAEKNLVALVGSRLNMS